MDLKRLIATGALLLTSLIPKSANSYPVKSVDGTDSIHPLLSSKLFAFLSNNSLLPDGITYNSNEVKQGSINEDSPEKRYTRSYNHFISWSNSDDGLWSFPSAKDWAMSPASQSGKIPFNLFPWPLSTYYQQLYPEENPDYPYGDQSWPRVVEQYQNGEIGTSFGHVFHLICDTTVPEHVRDDPHFWDPKFLEELLGGYYSEVNSLWGADVYEAWTDEHKYELINLLNPKSEKVPTFDSLSELLGELAYFTGSNFYSGGTVDGTVVGLTKVVEGNKTYFVKEIEGKKVHVLREGYILDVPDTVCFQDMWKVLGTKSIEYGAAALNLLAKEQPVEPPECTNECDDDQTSCKDNQIMICTNNDLDDCREWAPAVYCGSGQVCKGGDCVEDVADCISFSSKTCFGGDIYWQDSCGNLGDFINTCASNTYCFNGDCVTEPPTCEDECDTQNQISCSGNKVIKCDYNNNTGCLESVVQESCGGDEKCDGGKCIVQSCNPGNGGGSNSVLYDLFEGYYLDDCKWELLSWSVTVSDGKVHFWGDGSIGTGSDVDISKCSDDFTLESTLKTDGTLGLGFFTDFNNSMAGYMGITIQNSMVAMTCSHPEGFIPFFEQPMNSFTPIILQRKSGTLELIVGGKKVSLNCDVNPTFFSYQSYLLDTLSEVDSINLKCYN